MGELRRIKYIFTATALAALCFALPFSTEAYLAATDSPINIVIGQPDMTSKGKNQDPAAGTGTVAANTLYGSFKIYSDGTKLFVADYFNNRVLIYNTIPTSNDASADVAIGQPDMTSNSVNQAAPSGAANTLWRPTDVYSDGTKLYISDYQNSRVLIYNTIPATNDASADVVIGQADMTSNAQNRGGAAADNTLDWPRSVYSDGTKLYISDGGNNRILVYNTIPTIDGESADVVIGQTDMTSTSADQGATVAANTLDDPTHVERVGTKLLVTDNDNSRVLIYNTIPTANDASADVVIGQADMTSEDSNQGGAIGANTLGLPETAYSDGTRIYIADGFNHRVLIYNSIPTSNNASADVVIGQADMTSGLANRVDATTDPTGNTIYSPRDMLLVENRLLISESGNNRVGIHDVSPGITISETPGVGPISINSGGESTATHDVTLTLNATGARDMMISNSSSFAGASWETYAAYKEWDLSSGNSIKTVYVKFRDFALFESSIYSDDIELPSQVLPDAGKSTSYPLALLIISFLTIVGVITISGQKIFRAN